MSGTQGDEPLPSYEDTERSNPTTDAAAADSSQNESYKDRKSAISTVQQVSAASDNRASRMFSADSYYRHQTGVDGAASSEEDPDAPPAYSNTYGNIVEENTGFGTNARVADDGRVNIRINQHSRRLSKILVPALRNQLDVQREEQPPPYIPPSLGGKPGQRPPPPLNVVIHIVGSRGDVQPFVALGKVLKDTYGHRVRLATHAVFKGFVEENGLEFFNIGGDPAELMAFMVKNPGLMPGFDTLRRGDVGKRRRQIAEMIKGCWRSCIEAGDGSGVQAADQAIENWLESAGEDTPNLARPFVADAIIANPPSFAHIHCAERLGIPLHIMFTMPWSPTQVFPHPLANIQSSNADISMTNYMSYALVEMLTWQGLGDVINRFRLHSLGLEPISLMWAPGMLSRMRIPCTYCWSPALIPKPADWSSHISISGFYFLSLASNYTPDPDLLAFLRAGPPPVYIGFGSIVVDNPNAMTDLVFAAVEQTGQRALISQGWGGLGVDKSRVPEGVFMLGNVPHDWLFQHVACVVHHGGAGTTAAGIKAGRPTVVVPFFGDQPFWGAMVARAGAGPVPIPHKQLTAENLAAAIAEALKPSSVERARDLADKISQERGTDKGAQSFHQLLEVDKLRCSLLPDRAAVWRVKRTQIRLSAVAAYVLAEKNILSFADLKLYRPVEYDVDDGPWDPITGGGSALMGTVSSMMMGVADLPIEALKALHIHPDSVKEKARKLRPGGCSSVDSTSTSEPNTLSSPLSPPDSASMSSLLTSPSEPSISTHKVLIKRKPVPPNSSLSPPTTPVIVSRETNEDASVMLSPTSTTEEPALLTPPAATTVRTGSSAMAEALRNLPESSRPRSRSHGSPRAQSPTRSSSPSCDARRKKSADVVSHHVETLMGTGKGISRIIGAGLKSPMDFSLALAKGFHNVPKLYGEEVRSVDRVTGIKSGFTTASKELGYGLFEGITGLVTKPYEGARKEGAAGFVKGFGKGIAGVYLKPAAGAFGIPAYAMKGIHKEIVKRFGESTDGYIIAARTAQGFEEWKETNRECRIGIVHSYLLSLRETTKKRSVGEDSLDAVIGGGVEAVEKFIERRREMRRKKLTGVTGLKAKGRLKDFALGESQRDTEAGAPMPGIEHTDTVSSDATSTQHQGSISSAGLLGGETLEVPTSDRPALPTRGNSSNAAYQYYSDNEDDFHEKPTELGDADTADADDHDAALEEAIRQSISQPSRGTGGEDRLIEEAIRASIAELQRTSSIDIEEEEAEDEELKLVLMESARLHRETAQNGEQEDGIVGALREDGIVGALREDGIVGALREDGIVGALREDGIVGALRNGDVAGPEADEEEQLRRAMEESLKMDEQREKEMREEEIVMEYVKRASLAEAEFRRQMRAAADGKSSS